MSVEWTHSYYNIKENKRTKIGFLANNITAEKQNASWLYILKFMQFDTKIK